jgi:transposase
MKESKNADEYRRIQCVYLGILYPNMSAKKIGEVTLYSESRVWAIHADYRKKGLSGLFDARGGRYRENMTLAEEAEFLEPFIEKGKTGALAVAGEIKRAYEAKVGKKVAESTIYRLLDRHGFRKIVPYKRHTKANVEEQEAFKKTSSPSS